MIIYINGPINSGKTTISRTLLGRLPKSVHIEVDDLRNFAPSLCLEEIIPFALEDTITLARKWTERKFNVLISWPISKDNFKQIEYFCNQNSIPLIAFTLLPRLEICLSHRGSRKLTDWEKKRIPVLYNDLFKNDLIGNVIDNSELSIEETVQVILDKLLVFENKSN